MRSDQVVRVVLTGRLLVRNGGLLHPGEAVGLSSDEAETLVRRGVAVYESPIGAPAEELVMAVKEQASKVKAAPAPPVDKMWKRGPRK